MACNNPDGREDEDDIGGRLAPHKSLANNHPGDLVGDDDHGGDDRQSLPDPPPEKEDAIPMKIMSYDIEASSSHGDFPVPIKTYKKLIGEIIQHWTIHKKEIYKMSKSQKERLFIDLVCAAFKYGKQAGISRIYLYNKKDQPSIKDLIQKIQEKLQPK